MISARVPGVLGLDHHVEGDAFRRDVKKHPAVRDFQDIGAGLAETRGDAAEQPRLIIGHNAQRNDLILAFQPARQDRRQHSHVNIAA